MAKAKTLVGLDVQFLAAQVLFAAMLEENLRVLQLVTGKDSDDIRAGFDNASLHELANASDRRRRCRLAAHAVARECSFSGENLVVRNRFAVSVGQADRAQASKSGVIGSPRESAVFAGSWLRVSVGRVGLRQSRR